MGKLITNIGGGGSVDLDVITAGAEHILAGTVGLDKEGEPLEGSMPDNGAVAPSALGAGGSYTIPEGYHNGAGKVTVQSLADMTSAGDATAAQILSGKKAYVDGNLLIGTMTDRAAQTKTFTPSKSKQTYTIPAGYHNGSGVVTCNAIPSTYIAVSNANFFKNGTFGALYSRGIVAKVPKDLPIWDNMDVNTTMTTHSFTWGGEWETSTTGMPIVLPTISESNINSGVLSMEMNHQNSYPPSSDESDRTHAVCIRKTVDFTSISKVRAVIATSGAYDFGLCFWVINPTTKKGVCYLIKTRFNTQLSKTTCEINTSSMSGQCLFGFTRFGNYGTKGNKLLVTEISLVQ